MAPGFLEVEVEPGDDVFADDDDDDFAGDLEAETFIAPVSPSVDVLARSLEMTVPPRSSARLPTRVDSGSSSMSAVVFPELGVTTVAPRSSARLPTTVASRFLAGEDLP
jgi:hypothetical protein